ncbi:hypothetical protein B6U99_06480, partial [Candidatus Geothermarchaeota archaeon ex4572_27]
AELKRLPSMVEGPVKVLGGPAARFGIGLEGGRVAKLPSEVEGSFDLVVRGDVEVVVSDLLREGLNVDAVEGGAQRGRRRPV